MQSPKAKGAYAETVAVKYLKNTGHEVLDRNYYKRTGEIDIVAAYANTIIFVEVKSLKNENFLALPQTISPLKKRRLIKTCMLWLAENNCQPRYWRIDFIGLVIDGNRKLLKIRHLQNAIY